MLFSSHSSQLSLSQYIQAIRRYIKVCLKKERSPTEESIDDVKKPRKIKKVYTVRDVVKQKHCSLINKEIPYNPQTKEYLGNYQRAVTTVLKEMDSDERKKLEELAESWNEEGAPREVQFK